MIKRVDKRLQAVQCLTGNKIKIIACITMLIDHFSKIFLESIIVKHRFIEKNPRERAKALSY